MKISEYSPSQIESWIIETINTMSLDSGNRLKTEELQYFLKRLPDILNEKFSHINSELIESAWHKGSTGQYGLLTKLTINNLVSWIYFKIKENQELKRQANEDNDSLKYIEWNERFATPFGEFVCWLRRECNVYPQDVDENSEYWNEQHKVSPDLKNIESEYLHHKKHGTLEKYRNMIINLYTKE